jgi:microcystin-dependent protein
VPTYSFDVTNPTDTSLVSSFPANERAMRTALNSWATREHSLTGRHKLPSGTRATRNALTDLEDGVIFFDRESGLIDIRDGSGWTYQMGLYMPGDLKVVCYDPTSVPNGWLICNGQAVSTTTYSRLFAAIGSVWNAQAGGDPGGGSFRVPKLWQRYLIGHESGGDAIGTEVGANTVALVKEELPTDAIELLTSEESPTLEYGPGKTNTNLSYAQAGYDLPSHLYGGLAAGGSYWPVTNAAGDGFMTTEPHDHDLTWHGSGDAHENRPLSVVVGWLIKT